jgi:benzoyl-CoA reductase/2-hydroxyglutaryl-CoA dehydratase subunit BcrC/BadD/HgdB
MKRIGLTTTIPIEVITAAGYQPIDLNNILVTDSSYLKYIDIAEQNGFPQNLCAWIKGIYGICVTHNITEIVGVVEGDCSNTKSLLSVLRTKNITVYPFSFPHNHTLEEVTASIKAFMKIFSVSYEEVLLQQQKLAHMRKLAKEIDELTYKYNKATGFENHLYQVSCSDLGGNLHSFEKSLQDAVTTISARNPLKKALRIGVIGVPAITTDLFEYIESFNSQIVYNEVPHEFSFPRTSEDTSIYKQYYNYTYPYDIEFRVSQIIKEISVRQIDALIHYTQAFCYRAIEDIVIRDKIDIPILSIEGDKSTKLDPRTKLRIEAFMDMLIDIKESGNENIRN